MTYDHWKSTEDDQSEDYPFYDPCEDCQHEDYDADILIGRATCHYCGHVWWQMEHDVAAEIEHIRVYDDWQREQNRPWVRFKWWMLGLLATVKHRWLKRRSKIVDDIPF